MTNRFEPSQIKNKIKREEIAQKKKKAKSQEKLKKRLALAKTEANDPAAKKVRGVLRVKKDLLIHAPETAGRECSTNA
jgi:ribosome production factor 1